MLVNANGQSIKLSASLTLRAAAGSEKAVYAAIRDESNPLNKIVLFETLTLVAEPLECGSLSSEDIDQGSMRLGEEYEDMLDGFQQFQVILVNLEDGQELNDIDVDSLEQIVLGEFVECHFDGNKQAAKDAAILDNDAQNQLWNDWVDFMVTDARFHPYAQNICNPMTED